METLKQRLENFLARFPDNAACWSKATDELPDMYLWLSEKGTRFPPVGRENCHTPAEWNQKYKAAIREAIDKIDEKRRREFAERFATWLGARS